MNQTIKFKHLILSNAITILVILSLFLSYRVIASPDNSPAAPNMSMDVLSYQGTLADSSGNPVTGDQDMTFRIYNHATDPTPLWEEAHTGTNAVPVQNGLFNIMLGSLNPIPDSVWDEADLYLGIQVGSDPEMTPRELINLMPTHIPQGSLDGNVLKATSLERTVLRYYQFYYSAEGITFRDYQRGELETNLDPSLCQEDEWCCNAENTICLMKVSTGDARLAFNISGNISSCWLAHNDDDHPAFSKGVYYATNRGGTPFGDDVNIVFFFSNEGYSEVPIRFNATYDIYCFDQ